MCPFCYIGDEVLQQAAEAVGQPLAIRYHSFQLMPDLPMGGAANLGEIMEQQRGIPRQQFATMNKQVAARAAEIGLTYNLDQAVGTNTWPAHRLAHFAEQHGKQHEMMRRLFVAYFTEGRNIGDHDVLADLAAEIGLERAEALAAVQLTTHDPAIETDIAQARQIGISGVPFFVFEGRLAVSGAQSHAIFQKALVQAAEPA